MSNARVFCRRPLLASPNPRKRTGAGLCFIHIHIDQKDGCEIFRG